MDKKRVRNALNRLKALEQLEEWVNQTPPQLLNFVDQKHQPTRREVQDVFKSLKREALMQLYAGQELDDEAIEEARMWHVRNFAGVTADRDTLMQEDRHQLLRGMSAHGMIWDEKQARWRDVEYERTIEKIHQEFGTAAAQIIWG